MARALLITTTGLLVGAALSACAGPWAPAVRGLPADLPEAPLSVVWVGHATTIVRLGSARVLTDANFGDRLFVMPRETPASLGPRALPRIDVAIHSHLHFDHFDRPSLAALPAEVPAIFPAGSERYLTALGRRHARLEPWASIRVGGLRITAVPVAHFGGRYGIDALWNRSYTGYVIEGAGRTVFFAGDTGADPERFRAIARRFPRIDVALVPIAPYFGSSGNAVHVDPGEALDILEQTGARYMIPIHYEAYYGLFGRHDAPRERLSRLVAQRGLADRVYALQPGQRWVLPVDRAPIVSSSTVSTPVSHAPRGSSRDVLSP